jgi:hypothetical protein
MERICQPCVEVRLSDVVSISEEVHLPAAISYAALKAFACRDIDQASMKPKIDHLRENKKLTQGAEDRLVI